MRSSLYKDSQRVISTGKKQNKADDFEQNHHVTFGSLVSTERKALSYEYDVYMDQATTPLKPQITETKSYMGRQQVSVGSRHRQILLRLDEAENKLVISEKKYGELWRKYEVSCETIKTLNKEVYKLQSRPLQIKVKGKQQNKSSRDDFYVQLKDQIQELHKELGSKANEIVRLQRQLSSNKVKQQQSFNFQTQLDRLHKEKLSLVTAYEQKINYLTQEHQSQLRLMQNSFKQQLEKEMGKMVEDRLQKEETETGWIVERSKMNASIQLLKRENTQLKARTTLLQQANTQLKQQLNLITVQNSQISFQIKSFPQKGNQNQIHQLFYQLKSIKKQFTLLKQQLDQIEEQLKQTLQHNQQLIHKINEIETSKGKSDSAQLQKDRKLKQTQQQLINRLNQIDTEREQLERELLTQRLQSMKLKEQLQQQHQYQHRQYQLSLENLKTQLSQQIHSAKQEKHSETLEKEKIYLQMKELQRKYQLLQSQMLTVDDMMNIATRVHKRHSHFVKK